MKSSPDYPALDYQITETVKVYDILNHRIAQLTYLSLEAIEMLGNL